MNMRMPLFAVALVAATATVWWFVQPEEPPAPVPAAAGGAPDIEPDQANQTTTASTPATRQQAPARLRAVLLLDAATRQPLAGRRLLVTTDHNAHRTAETSANGRIELPAERVSLTPAEGDWFAPVTATIDASVDSLSLDCFGTFEADLSKESAVAAAGISIRLVASDSITPRVAAEWQRTRRLPPGSAETTVATARIGEKVRIPSGARICALVECELPVVVTPSHPAWSGHASEGKQGRTTLTLGVGTTKGIPVSAPMVATPGAALRVSIAASPTRAITLLSDLPGAQSPAMIALYRFHPKGPNSLVAQWAEVATWTEERSVPVGGSAHTEGCLPGRYRVTATSKNEGGFVVSSKTFEVQESDVQLRLSDGVGTHTITVEVAPSVGLPPTAQLAWNVASRPRGVTRGLRLDVYGGLWSGPHRFRITGLSQPTGKIMLRHPGGSKRSDMIAFDTEKTGEVTWR